MIRRGRNPLHPLLRLLPLRHTPTSSHSRVYKSVVPPLHTRNSPTCYSFTFNSTSPHTHHLIRCYSSSSTATTTTTTTFSSSSSNSNDEDDGWEDEDDHLQLNVESQVPQPNTWFRWLTISQLFLIRYYSFSSFLEIHIDFLVVVGRLETEEMGVGWYWEMLSGENALSGPRARCSTSISPKISGFSPSRLLLEVTSTSASISFPTSNELLLLLIHCSKILCSVNLYALNCSLTSRGISSNRLWMWGMLLNLNITMLHLHCEEYAIHNRWLGVISKH